MKNLVAYIANALFCLQIIAQEPNTPLKIGDKVPDILFEHIINYPMSKAKLSDLKGQLIILDLWGPGCSACITAFPKMEKLQDEFRNKLQVLAVTRAPLSELKNLFDKSAILKTTKLSMAFGDTAAYRLFPYSMVPYHIWIDENRIVRAMTNGYNATDGHIREFLKDDKIQFTSFSQTDAFDYDKPILNEGNGRQLKNIKYHSLITKKLTAEPGAHLYGFVMDSGRRNAIGIRAINHDMKALLARALGFEHWDRIIVELPNPEKYFEPSNPDTLDKWKAENLYSYEIVMPGVEPNKLVSLMQKELEIYFNVTVSREVRKLRCLILHRTTPEDMIASKDLAVAPFKEITSNRVVLKNFSLDYLIFEAILPYNMQLHGPKSRPLLNETGYKGLVNLEINAPLTDMKLLNKELKKYGLEFIEAFRNVEMLVIKENVGKQE